MAFKTQAEIFKALIDGKKIVFNQWMKTSFAHLKDGFIRTDSGSLLLADFSLPEAWSIYEEPKPRKKVTLYNYTYVQEGVFLETGFTSKSFVKNSILSQTKLIKTESKEVEYDDV